MLIYKFIKISISVLLILSIILNPLGSLFDIRAGAFAGVTFGEWLVDFFLQQIVFYSGQEVVNYTVNNYDKVVDDTKFAVFTNYENFITRCDEIQVFYDVYETPNPAEGVQGTYKPIGFYVDETKIMTPEHKAECQEIVDLCNEYLARGGSEDLVFYEIGGAYGFDCMSYAKVKEDFTNMLIEEMANENIIEMGEAGVLPIYNFDFVGPQPSISAPVMNGIASLQKDGFIYTPPIPSDKGKFSSQTDVMTYLPFGNDVTVRGNETQGFSGSVKTNCYGYSHYVLYNGTLYYYNQGSYTGSQYEVSFGYTGDFGFTKSIFYASDGTCLADVYNEGDSFSHGFCVNTTGQVPSYAPTLASATEKDFISEVGGGTVEIPRSEVEDIIRKAQEMGLAVPDSWIEFANDGSIQSVDGIELSKLQELIDAVNAGNLGFENVQEYLDLLTKLVGAGNLTATQQKTLLDNINANTLAISEAMTKGAELEDVEFENSYLLVEHTGFKEAQTIVDGIPIIGQSKTLLNNLFETTKVAEQNNNNVPNFSFYWDSNKDGTKEKYTLLDLSFMEQRLSNSNLEDKGRFSSSMTIRQFVQSLIILIAYSLFAIKLLKRLPGFFGGVALGADNIDSTIKQMN